MKEKNRSLLISAVITFLIACLLYHKYLIGNAPYLYSVSDGFTQFLPIYKSYIHTLEAGNGLLQWNFSIGFGEVQSYLKLFYPTNLIPVLLGWLVSEKAMLIGAAWMQVVKMVMSTIFMFLFLRKLKFDAKVCGYIGVIYALNGILMVRGYWWMLGDECYLAVLILWSAECFYKEKNWHFIPLVIAVLASGFGLYYVYLYGLELFLYATVRYIYDHKTFKGYFRFITSCGGLYIIGLLISGAALLDYGRTLTSTARYTDTQNYVKSAFGLELIDVKALMSGLISLFDVNISGVFHSYTGALNYLERPIFYCGLGSLFLIPQGFLLGKNKRTKRMMLGGFGIASVYFLFSNMTDIFNMFVKNEEMGLRSYRMSSLWIVIMLCIMAGYGLQQILDCERVHRLGAAATGIMLSVLLAVCVLKAPAYEMAIDFNVCRWVICFLVALLIFFVGIGKKRMQQSMQWLYICFFALTLLEMGHSARTTVNGSIAYANYYYEIMHQQTLGYYGDVEQAIEYIKKRDSGFYRISGVHPDVGSFCTPLYFGFNDSSYYTNINEKTYTFLAEVYPESFTTGLGSKYSEGVGDNLELSTLTGYKYRLEVADNSQKTLYGYKKINTIGSIDIYENEYALPVGISYRKYIRLSDFKAYDDEAQRKILLYCVVIDDTLLAEDIEAVSKAEIEEILSMTTEEAYRQCVDERSSDAFLLQSWKQDAFKGEAVMSQTGMMVFSIPNVTGWKLYVDGEEQKIVDANIGFIAVKLTKGEHMIELSYQANTRLLGNLISLTGIALYIILLIIEFKYPQLIKRLIYMEEQL